MASTARTVKAEAHRLLDKLPDDATWDDIVYELAVRRSVERGLNDADAGRLVDAKELRREFNLE